jgi:hypothetical protein
MVKATLVVGDCKEPETPLKPSMKDLWRPSGIDQNEREGIYVNLLINSESIKTEVPKNLSLLRLLREDAPCRTKEVAPEGNAAVAQ